MTSEEFAERKKVSRCWSLRRRPVTGDPMQQDNRDYKCMTTDCNRIFTRIWIF